MLGRSLSGISHVWTGQRRSGSRKKERVPWEAGGGGWGSPYRGDRGPEHGCNCRHRKSKGTRKAVENAQTTTEVPSLLGLDGS